MLESWTFFIFCWKLSKMARVSRKIFWCFKIVCVPRYIYWWCWLTPTLQYIWLAPTLDIYLTLPNSVLYWTHPNTNNAYICIYLTHTDSWGYLTSPNKCIYLTLPNTFLNTKCTEYFVGASSCHCIWLSPTLFIIDTSVIASYYRKD